LKISPSTLPKQIDFAKHLSELIESDAPREGSGEISWPYRDWLKVLQRHITKGEAWLAQKGIKPCPSPTGTENRSGKLF